MTPHVHDQSVIDETSVDTHDESDVNSDIAVSKSPQMAESQKTSCQQIEYRDSAGVSDSKPYSSASSGEEHTLTATDSQASLQAAEESSAPTVEQNAQAPLGARRPESQLEFFPAEKISDEPQSSIDSKFHSVAQNPAPHEMTETDVNSAPHTTTETDEDSAPYVTYIEYFQPPGVIRPCSAGSTCYIGFLNDETVLKYPYKAEYRELVANEARIYDALGYHPHILRYHGKNEHGLVLDYAANGTVKGYLENNPLTTTKQRVTWCRELVEALVHIHSKNVLHCNICASNLLLDKSLSSKVADFQGTLKDPLTGSNMFPCMIGEASKWHLPREFGDDSTKSDIFAVGSTIYEIMAGHEPFPELDAFHDDEVIEARFAAGQLPDVHAIPGSEIIRKCWLQRYQGADECLADLIALEAQYPEGH